MAPSKTALKGSEHFQKLIIFKLKNLQKVPTFPKMPPRIKKTIAIFPVSFRNSTKAKLKKMKKPKKINNKLRDNIFEARGCN